MALQGWDIVGFDASYLLPIFAAQINYAAGPAVGQGALPCLLVGLKTASGNLVLDTEVRQVFSKTDIIAACGVGSELALMALAALKASPNVPLWLAAVTQAGGTAGTATITIGGASTAVGTYYFWINGVRIVQSIGASDSIATFGANLAATINASPDCPFTAAYATNVVTLTHRQTSVRSIDWIVYQDTQNVTGLTMALAGASAVNTLGTVSGVRVGATLGAGADNVTAILTKLGTRRWGRIAFAQNDASNAALIKAFLAAQAAVTVQLYSHAMYGFNGTQGAATTLAQSTLNDPRESVYAIRNCETHPAIIAAGWAALRAATETASPVPDYDNKVTPWIAPQRFDADIWLASEANALLNAGVTPLTTVNGAVYCLRAVGSYSLNGASQDTRCLDIGDSVFPDYAVIDLANLYSSVFRTANTYAQDNPNIAAGELEPPAGVAYPLLWVSAVKNRMAFWQKQGWIIDTFSGKTPAYPVLATWNVSARRIQSGVNFVVQRVMHQLSVTANQSAPPL